MNTVQEDSKRLGMWFRIFGPDYLTWDKNKRKRMKEAYAEERGLQVHEVSLDCCDLEKVPVPCPVRANMLEKNKIQAYESNWLTKYAKEENAMNSAANMTINAPAPTTESDENTEKRSYLITRLHSAVENKKEKARKDFGLVDDASPRSPKEVVERIKSGNFTISKNWTEEMDEYGFNLRTVVDYMRWRDPSKVEDKAGYETWRKEVLRPARTQLEDTIAIKSPLEALTELQAWEVA